MGGGEKHILLSVEKEGKDITLHSHKMAAREIFEKICPLANVFTIGRRLGDFTEVLEKH